MAIAPQIKIAGVLAPFLARPWDRRPANRRSRTNKDGKYLDLADWVPSHFQSHAPYDISQLAKASVWPTTAKVDSNFLLRMIPKEAALPVMRLSFNFQQNLSPRIRMRVFLFMHHKLEIKAQGFRFETPEGEDGANSNPSTHDYFHAQQITGFEKNDDRLAALVVPWLPVSQPAFCLDACNPVQLVVNFLISLYGLTEVKQSLIGSPNWRHIKSDLDNMHVRQRLE
jgi:hypothetical protein